MRKGVGVGRAAVHPAWVAGTPQGAVQTAAGDRA